MLIRLTIAKELNSDRLNALKGKYFANKGFLFEHTAGNLVHRQLNQFMTFVTYM